MLADRLLSPVSRAEQNLAVRRCRPKENKDVFETMKKLERDIRKQDPTVIVNESKSASLASTVV